ncbi:hypothetical protein BOTCAL_0266g00010 [Botryotinia calthae]|uniref:Uncharacterized protein n=1 Tax=Botryotinia calthae TaxID=38488 RepID=A0A4Y8CVV6_9HELO|nr:hypothetical protein BOTCAL_0266g00010 [Botryotinia calthae]
MHDGREPLLLARVECFNELTSAHVTEKFRINHLCNSRLEGLQDRMRDQPTASATPTTSAADGVESSEQTNRSAIISSRNSNEQGDSRAGWVGEEQVESAASENASPCGPTINDKENKEIQSARVEGSQVYANEGGIGPIDRLEELISILETHSAQQSSKRVRLEANVENSENSNSGPVNPSARILVSGIETHTNTRVAESNFQETAFPQSSATSEPHGAPASKRQRLEGRIEARNIVTEMRGLVSNAMLELERKANDWCAVWLGKDGIPEDSVSPETSANAMDTSRLPLRIKLSIEMTVSVTSGNTSDNGALEGGLREHFSASLVKDEDKKRFTTEQRRGLFDSNRLNSGGRKFQSASREPGTNFLLM